MIVIKTLSKWIEQQKNKPLSEDYQKAIDDMSKVLEDISKQLNRDHGDIVIEISGVGDFGFSSFSGPAINGFEQLVDYIDRHTLRNKEHKGKFLVEIKDRKINMYEKFFK